MKKILIVIFVLLTYLIIVCPGTSFSADNGQVQIFDPVPVSWYERNVKKQAWLSLDEAASFQKDAAPVARSFQFIKQIITQNRFITVYELEVPTSRKQFQNNSSQSFSALQALEMRPVFYTSPRKNPADRLAMTAEIVVQFKNGLTQAEIQAAENTYDLVPVRAIAKLSGTFIYRTASVFQSLETANALHASGLVNYSFPNIYRSRSTRDLPDDLLFADQWHLNNTGQAGGQIGADVNILPVWDHYQGSVDTVIALLDDGLAISHDDLIDNVLLENCWDYVDQDSDPSHDMFLEGHGTRVAGVAAARGFNQIGVSGAAPHAGLVGFRLMGASTDVNVADALMRHNEIIDIYSNSWGPPDWSPTYGRVYLDGPSPLVEDAMASGIRNGRSGLGSIYVWAGGNGYNQDDSNYDGYANSRFTIAVAASTNMGKRAVYSERGANILINASSGDVAPGDGTLAITTTDRNTGYTGRFNGTSAAAPLVSGIIALMLDANPQLSWRDVQHILIETARQNDPDDGDWMLNDAGYPINHKYGFGLIDAGAAVTAAAGWDPAGDELLIQAASTPQLIIPDNNEAGVSDTVFITENIQVEFVEVYFSAADHPHWGNLEIVLTSPGGTPSVLARVHDQVALGSKYDNWRFGSVRHYGESSHGNWTLAVRDLTAGDSGTFQNWTLKIYGADPAFETATVSELVAFVTRLYEQCLGRLPDQNGLDYWVNNLLDGSLTGADVTRGFFTSQELLNQNLTDSEFVTMLYEVLFDRQPDEPEYVHWLSLLQNGVERKHIFEGFVQDQEFRSMCRNYTITSDSIEVFVTRFYQQFLNRAPDPPGLEYWVAALLDGGQTGADIARGFIFSTEFAGRNTTFEQYLTMLYRVLLNRNPDETGFSYWLERHRQGYSAEDVVEGFVFSTEFAALCESYGIAAF